MNGPTGTIDDFSVQWTEYFDNDGFFSTDELLEDYLQPLMSLEDLQGKRVAEIGCGNGRFVKIFAEHAAHATGIEPGGGARNAASYVSALNNAEVIQASVYDLPELEPLDHVFSLGVVHHLPDPARALRIMRERVKPGGSVTIWVYGHEGNELYLAAFGALRKVTQRLPHRALHHVSSALTVPLKGYVEACKRTSVPLPMHDYAKSVLGPLSLGHLRLVVYDQLNPKIAFYWKRHEVEHLMKDAGLVDVRLHHRHGYSWTATGRRPSD